MSSGSNTYDLPLEIIQNGTPPTEPAKPVKPQSFSSESVTVERLHKVGGHPSGTAAVPVAVSAAVRPDEVEKLQPAAPAPRRAGQGCAVICPKPLQEGDLQNFMDSQMVSGDTYKRR